jgi:hypothetical protein
VAGIGSCLRVRRRGIVRFVLRRLGGLYSRRHSKLLRRFMSMGSLVHKRMKLSFATFGVSFFLFAPTFYSTSATANPSAPEVYQFSINPAVLDLSTGDGVVRVRFGVRDEDGLADVTVWCQGEPHTESVRVSVSTEYGVERIREMWDQPMTWSGDETDLSVEVESHTIYRALTVAGVHNCQITAYDMLGNEGIAYTQYTVTKSSSNNTPEASANPSNSSKDAPATETPSPNSSKDAPATETPSPYPVSTAGSEESTKQNPDANAEQNTTSLIISSALVTALVIGSGIFAWQRFGPKLKQLKK